MTLEEAIKEMYKNGKRQYLKRSKSLTWMAIDEEYYGAELIDFSKKGDPDAKSPSPAILKAEDIIATDWELGPTVSGDPNCSYKRSEFEINLK